jgi:geranylgeranyl reductase family protein
MRFDADVLVVGAGPAGATAARTLAAGGARVRILERHHFPRNKPCGGGITMRALGRFPHLGPALPRISTHTVSRLLLEGPSGETVTIQSREPAVLLVRRVEFDHLLAELAVEAGAELVEGATISRAVMHDDGVELTSRDGRTFRAPVAIAADGVNSVVARRLGFNTGWPPSAIALDMMEETPTDLLRSIDPGLLWVSYGHGSSDGYAYIFPKRDHVNIGIGYLLSYFRDREPGAPYALQQQLIAALRERGVVEGASSRPHFTPFLIPVGGPLPTTARQRVLLAGDAGGFVNGYTAEGIYYAMVSGELAAKAILGNGSRPAASRARRPARPDDHPAVARYIKAWRDEIGVELRDAVLIRKYLFHEARRVDGVVRGAKTYPMVADMIVGYATGTVSYRAARRRLLSQFPRVAFKLLKIGLFG